MKRNSCLCVLALATMVLSAHGGEPTKVEPKTPDEIRNEEFKLAVDLFRALSTGVECVPYASNEDKSLTVRVVNLALTAHFQAKVKVKGAAGHLEAAQILRWKADELEALAFRASMITDPDKKRSAWVRAYNALDRVWVRPNDMEKRPPIE